MSREPEVPYDPGQTPAALGYRMPAEWEPHAATWLSWPRNPETWPGQFEPIPAVWSELARTLAWREPVRILAGREQVWRQAEAMAGGIPGVTLVDIPTNDAWARDHGPIFLVGPEGAPPALIDWNYNAWGGKYPPFDLDDQVPRRVAESLAMKRFSGGIVLEGGAIDVNGHGALLTSEECLLNPNRNPDLSRSQIERYLADFLAAPSVIWLGQGIVGDDTDGHIDELARFVAPRVVLAAWEEDPADENYKPLADNWRRLELARDEQGRPLELIRAPMPGPLFYDSRRLPACYMNFYIANGVVVAPCFGDPADETALEILRKVFPDRRVVGLYARDLVWGLGAFHCITQQQPA